MSEVNPTPGVTELRPVCLGCRRSMESMGSRWRCRACGRTKVKCPTKGKHKGRRLVIRNGVPVVVDTGHGGYPIKEDNRGRSYVQLGVGHPWSNSAGWQWLSRVLVAYHLGRPLETHEQVAHTNNDRTDDRIENLAVVVSANGENKQWNHHRSSGVMTVAEWDSSLKRFVEFDEPTPF